MTTQEKAEKYAEVYRCPATNENEYCKHDVISAYNNGYTQCQLDITDKKYTEEDMLKCWNTAFTDAMNIDSETYKPIFYSDFINSLNKQD